MNTEPQWCKGAPPHSGTWWTYAPTRNTCVQLTRSHGGNQVWYFGVHTPYVIYDDIDFYYWSEPLTAPETPRV